MQEYTLRIIPSFVEESFPWLVKIIILAVNSPDTILLAAARCNIVLGYGFARYPRGSSGCGGLATHARL
ncbi:hypothetical protein [Pyrofollis japonicus]|uniref:hypothetical protein n=1 Tax=Pyrofollis japonicus TaxID=3060460 RepID=UPI00295C1D16|nr:hypothetical protein [Pyrofollis japonicus]